jgi:iron complex outermembrane receptor protein
MAKADSSAGLSGEVLQMEKFDVTGTRPKEVDSTTLKLPTTIQDTPRSVTVIDSSRIREQDFQSGSDVLLWVPGVNTNGAVQESYHFYARGFRQVANEWRVDGFQGRTVGGSYSPNLFGVEQVSVLKGPAGLLYGTASSPGGMINLVTKKPRDIASVTVDTRLRTFAGQDSALGDRVSYEVELDATGPVTQDGRLLYRFLSSVEESALTYRGQSDRNQFYRLSFTRKLDAAGRYQLTPLVEWSTEDRATRNAVISPSSSRTTNDGRTDYTTADVSPRSVNLAAGSRVDGNLTWGADLAAQYTPAWRGNTSFHFHERGYENNAWTIQTATLAQTNPADPLSWVLSRRHARAKSEFETVSFDTNTTGEYTPTDWARTMLQFGLNGRLTDNQAYTAATSALNQSPINIYTGIAATPLVADVPRSFALGNRTKGTVWNAYAQSQTEFWGKAIFTAGFAYARETGKTITPAGVTTVNPARNSDLTPNLSLVYRLTKDLSLYTSYSTSYALADPTFEDVAGRRGTFNPTEGDSYEIGAKAALWGELVAASLSVFDTELNGVLVQSEVSELNPNGNRFYRQLDTGRKSRGVEAEFTVSPVHGWDTTATYAYIDAFNRNLDGSRGAPAEMTPRHAVSVYSRYAFPKGALQGFSVRLGVIWQSDRWSGSAAPSATAPDPLLLKSFHRIDVGAGYRWKHWSFALNIENLADSYFLLAGSTGVSMSPVNPRSIALRTSYTW